METSETKTNLWISEHLNSWTTCLYEITQVLVAKQTAYQKMQIVEMPTYGKSLFLDGELQSSAIDEFLYHEPLVHPAMLACGDPKQVLILGGGEGATLREVLRWKSVDRVVMIDIDGEVLDACRQYLPEMHQNAFDDPRTEVIVGDAIEFVEQTGDRWDVIISDLSNPIEDGPSFKLFTREYFEKIHRLLNPNGYFAMQAGEVDLHNNLSLHIRLVNTLKTVFPQVQSYTNYIPSFLGAWGFVLASAQAIETQSDPNTIDRLLAEKTTGQLRMFDGISLLGMMQLPRYIREAIAKETQIYTLADPPNLKFG